MNAEAVFDMVSMIPKPASSQAPILKGLYQIAPKDLVFSFLGRFSFWLLTTHPGTKYAIPNPTQATASHAGGTIHKVNPWPNAIGKTAADAQANQVCTLNALYAYRIAANRGTTRPTHGTSKL